MRDTVTHDLEIVTRDLHSLKPNPGNPRTHSKLQIRQIAASIREFGFINPILIDQSDRVIAGHGRLEAARSMGLRNVPTVRVDHLSPAQIKAYVIADNKLALNAGWDDGLLALDLEELSTLFDYDIAVTGFQKPEVDILFQAARVLAKDEDVPTVDRSRPPISRPGDLIRASGQLACMSPVITRTTTRSN